MSGSRFPVAFVAGAVGLGCLVTLLYVYRSGEEGPQVNPGAPAARSDLSKPEPVSPQVAQVTEVDEPQSPEEALDNAGVGVAMADPADLIGQIGVALEAGDLAAAAKLIGSGALTPEARKRLAELAATGGIKLRRPDPVQEVGELKLNERSRWAIWLEGAEAGRDRIFFDLFRDKGKWSIESLILPPGPGEPVAKAVLVDALGIADAFLQATLKQDFEKAKEFVDTTAVSDAKIAGLCILFEEGRYRLRPKRPLRAMLQRPDSAGYLAHVETADGEEAAEFTMALARTSEAGDWQVNDLNLDELLADYARRVAGGDVYFTPLVKNPKGGDTLVLYFGFDEDELSPRSARQLGIVAHILRTDPGKKLTISGHTDALGTEQYNDQLSARRAATVKRYLVEEGVAEEQIITIAQGQSQPRRPNFTESGEDNPTGRRANRRTEIYLDF